MYDFIDHVTLEWMDHVEAIACDMNSDFQEARDSKVISKGSTLFNKNDVVRKEGYEDKYNSLLKENELLFTLDVIKAYSLKDESSMAEELIDIMDICEATKNSHLLWFRRLIDSHFEGMIAHATYKISAGKIEGINNKIKTIRRQGYGYPDDEYFFLKLFDMSREVYVRNTPSHKICD